MLSLQSPHWGDSNENTQYTIFNMNKKNTLNYPKSAAMGFCPRDSRTSSKQRWWTSHQYSSHWSSTVYSFIAPILINLGACPSFGVLYEHCGTFKKRWELTGPEYLIQFHTDSSVQKTGFQMDVSLGNITFYILMEIVLIWVWSAQSSYSIYISHTIISSQSYS